MTDPRSGFSDSLILREMQNIHEALTKTKEEHTLNFRMIKPTEKFNFSEPIFDTTKLGLIRLSVHNSLFNVNGNKNKFRFNSLDRQIFSDTKFYIITSDAYELSEIAEIIKEETEGNVIIEVDKNTMKCKMEIKQGVRSFDVENSIGSLLGFRKVLYRAGTYTSQKIVDIMVFNNINIHCNIISGAKYYGKDTDILYTFNLTEPPGYLISIIPTNILYQNVTKDRIEYTEFHIKDEHGRPIDFNGDVLSFTLHLC